MGLSAAMTIYAPASTLARYSEWRIREVLQIVVGKLGGERVLLWPDGIIRGDGESDGSEALGITYSLPIISMLWRLWRRLACL